MGKYMMNIFSFVFVVVLNISSLNAFNWNNLDSLEPAGSIDFELKWHPVAKRSLQMDSHAPREIITTLDHDNYSNLTLKFVRKNRHRLPSVTASNGKGEFRHVSQPGRQCVWLYEDDRNNAFILVDFCRQIRKLHMIGEVFINGTKHMMLSNRDSYELYRCKGHQELFPDSERLNTKQYKHYRRRRQTGEENMVELMFYVDDSIYGFFYGFNNEPGLTDEQRQQQTLEEIVVFYTYIAQGMNYRYQTITAGGIQIQLKLVSINIQEVPNNLSGQTDAVTLLNSFTNYVRQQRITDVNFPSVDHYMLITNLDLEYLGDRNSSGFANQASMCGSSPTKATSIVEDRFNFISEVVFSHELGHSLGALHDGDGNNCAAEEGFIMSAFNLVYRDNRALNMWRFSTCTQQAMADFITDLNNNNNNCMRTINEPDLDAITTVGPLLGQVYEPDEQCKRMFTSSSELVRIMYFETGFEGICSGMWCSTTSISNQALVLPADGTSCGNRKWCQSGQCVSSNSAPAKTETCIFGDQPGEVSPGITCAQHLSGFSGGCYQTNVRVPCCTSCEAQRLTIPGCEYGDRGNCSVIQAPDCYSQNVLDGCCKTCNDYIKPDLPESCKYGDKNSACVPASCAANSDICCETCRVEATTESTNGTSSEDNLPETCIFGDQPGEVSPGITCAQYLSDFSGGCYQTNVRVPCCTSCTSTILPGCEYGDRRNCSVIQAPDCYSQNVLDDCCKTCNDYIKPDLPESCKYGDKNSTCVPASCAANSDICCETCRVEATTESTNGTSSEDNLPDWVIPTAAAVGGIIFISVSVIIICCIMRNKTDKKVKRIMRANSQAGRQPRRPEPANGLTNPNRIPDNRYSQPNSMRGGPNNLQPNYSGRPEPYRGPGTYAVPMNFSNMVVGNTRNPRGTAMHNHPNRA